MDQTAQLRPVEGLGRRSARGLVYLFAGSSAAKVVSLLAQYILSFLLTKEDYGVIGLAVTFTIFIQVIEQSGVGDVLVRRKRFLRWAIPGFWLALSLGALSCSLIMLVAPLAAKWFDSTELFGALLLLAPSSITNALAVVPKARLSRELRFRLLAAINLANLTARMVLAVVLAVLGFGAYSWVMPVPITGAVSAAFLWWWVRPPWSPRLHFRRWKYLLGDSTQLLFGDFGLAALGQTDNLLLGAYRSVSEVGIYFFGYTFSVQMLQLLTVNLTQILFPALNKLNHRPEARLQAFLNAQRILSMLGISSCFLQAAAAEPLTRVFLRVEWIPAIGVMQILSLGMATRMIAASSFAFLKAQGRFAAISAIRWGFLGIQVVALCTVLSLGGGAVSVAYVVAIVSALIGPVTFHSAIRGSDLGWRTVGQVLLPPVLSSGAAVSLAWAAAQFLDQAGFGYPLQLVTTIVVSVVLGAVFARAFMRPIWDDLWARAWQLFPARTAP